MRNIIIIIIAIIIIICPSRAKGKVGGRDEEKGLGGNGVGMGWG